MMKKAVSLLLVFVLALGLTVPVVAAGQTFNDVPSTYWGYADIEAVAEAGLMNGTGGGAFSPEMKVSVAQFVTLLGRLVFPETTVGANDTWYGPYVEAAQTNGLLAGTQVNVNDVEAEISRYDMAVILRAAGKKLGVAEKTAQSSEVSDYGMVPTMYADSVLAVYGMGLIKGDQAGNFNGSNTMMRAEVATVIMRLAKAKPGGSQGGGVEPTASPEPSSTPEVTPSPTPEIPDEPQIVTGKMKGGLRYYPVQGEAGWGASSAKLAPAGIPYKLLYTEDGGTTSQVILEGKTSEPFGEFDSEFPISRALLENPNGQFFISAESEIEGRKFVTQDRRTDGRRAISTVEVYEKGTGVGNAINVLLVPPTGQRWDFELTGNVPNSAEAADYYFGNGKNEYHDIFDSYTAFTIQLVYYPSPELQDRVPTGTRIVLGETTGNEDGKFVLPVSMDTLDLVSGENFRIEVFGTYRGQYHHSSPRTPLKTLSDIKTSSDAAWGTHLLFDRP